MNRPLSDASRGNHSSHRKGVISLFASVCLLFSSCSLIQPTEPPPPSPPNPTIKTDQSQYQVRRIQDPPWEILRVEIGYRFTNPTDSSVYVHKCQVTDQPIIERWNGQEWVDAYSPPQLACLEQPTAIAPDATYTDTLEMASPSKPGNPGQFKPDTIRGHYRLVWEVYRNVDPETYHVSGLLPLEDRISNTFRLEPR